MALSEWPPHGTLVIWENATSGQIPCAVIGKDSHIAKAIWAERHQGGNDSEYVSLSQQERDKTCWVMVLEHATSEEWDWYFGLANPPLANLTLAKAILIEDNTE